MLVLARNARVTLAYVVVLLAGSAYGAVKDDAGEPAHVPKRFERRPQIRVLPRKDTRKAPRSQPQRTWQDEVSFVLKGVDFAGMTRYRPDDVRYLYNPLLNREVGLRDLRQLAFGLTARYRKDGYLLSYAAVPPQTIEEGRITVQVVEAGIDGLVVTGANRARRSRPVALANKIAEETPLHVSTLERYSLLADDLPGVNAHATLLPSHTIPGMWNLVMELDERKGDLLLRIDNRGTRYSGPVQLHGAASVNSWLRPYDRTRLYGVTAESPEELQLVSLHHDTPLGLEGGRLRLGGTASWQEPGHLLGDLETDSESTRWHPQFYHPVVRRRHATLSARVVFDAFDIETEQLGTQVSRERLRSLRLGSTLDWADEMAGINVFEAELSRGLGILNALENDAANRSRARGRNDYTKISLYASRLQRLGGAWTLHLHIAGQYAFDHLLASEEFSYGGVPFGRAHNSSEESGDHGVAANAEIQFSGIPTPEWVERWQVFGYLGAGRVWRRDDATREADETLADAGLGARLWMGKAYSVTLETAKPLTGSVAAEEKDGYDWRFFFAAEARF